MTPLPGRWPKLRRVILVVAGAVFVAVTVFRVPLATAFTFGVLTVCPFLMVGMHGGGQVEHSPTDGARAHVGGGIGSVIDRWRRRLGPAPSQRQHREVQS